VRSQASSTSKHVSSQELGIDESRSHGLAMSTRRTVIEEDNPMLVAEYVA
jgi:hypothetical protein